MALKASPFSHWSPLHWWLGSVRDLVFEPWCLACDERLELNDRAQVPSSSAFCRDCLEDLHSSLPGICRRCAAELPGAGRRNGECRLCRDLNLRFDSAVAVGNYHRTLSELIVRMKGQRDEALAWQLGRLLAARVTELWPEQRFDMIVPVPAWWGRRLKRGFVASEVIAQSVGKSLGLPVDRRVLRCGRSVAKQGTLSTPARFRNVAGLFQLRAGRAVKGKAVLLVDDVMTSGATVSQAAAVLKRPGGARVVDVAVVARGARGN